MDIFVKTLIKDGAQIVIPSALLTGTAALLAAPLSVPTLAATAFVGTFALTASLTSKIAEKALEATGLKTNHPFKYAVVHLTAGVACSLIGLGSAAALTSALGLPIAFGAGCTTLVVSALALTVSLIAAGIIFGAAALGAFAITTFITYQVLKNNDRAQSSICTFLNNHGQQSTVLRFQKLFN